MGLYVLLECAGLCRDRRSGIHGSSCGSVSVKNVTRRDDTMLGNLVTSPTDMIVSQDIGVQMTSAEEKLLEADMDDCLDLLSQNAGHGVNLLDEMVIWCKELQQTNRAHVVPDAGMCESCYVKQGNHV